MDRDSFSAGGVFQLTKSDTVNETKPIRGIGFAVEGDIKVTDIFDNDYVIPNGVLAAGIMHPLRIKRVWSTGTDVPVVVGYYG